MSTDIMKFRRSLLPKAGGNKFQKIKEQTAEAQQKNPNLKIIKLSIGQPEGPAIIEACAAAAIAILTRKENIHEYQDNGMPGCPDFAPRFVQCHVKTKLANIPKDVIDYGYLAIPGIKPTIDVVLKALGSWTCVRNTPYQTSIVGTMTEPGYPTPKDQGVMIKGIELFDLPAIAEKGFLFDPSDIDAVVEQQFPGRKLGEGDMLMLNLPLNPAGIVARREWLEKLCAYCEERGIRLVNDAAYSMLVNSEQAVTLTDVAVNFPGLNWGEMFSASKAGNNTGWRIGAVVGSPEFMGDIKRINGNMNSGPVAAMAIGALELFEKYPHKIAEYRDLYHKRLIVLRDILHNAGMRIAVNPEAGFFLLYDVPKFAFGREIKDAEEFNALLIEETGVVGVPFGASNQWIRFAICAADVIALKSEIQRAFEKAQVSY